MPFLHKYQEHNFENGFETHNSILDIVPYNPEVIFIGSYNHGWDWNESDFYYGRAGYMWPIMANLFLYNHNHLTHKRTNIINPTIQQIFDICESGKIVFADIIKGINENIIAIAQPQHSRVLVNNEFEWKGYKDDKLDYMGNQGWLDDNTEAIIKYINEQRTIKHVYFTFKSGGWLVDKLNHIVNGIRDDVTSCSIFTPTANGFLKSLNPPFDERAWSLTHCWIWNGLIHNILINRPGYGHLNHDWLIQNGVNPENF